MTGVAGIAAVAGAVVSIDGNFAGAALIVEMLMQSDMEQIKLLPALPKAWPKGYVKGLVARGGFELDITWENGKLAQATIKSLLGNKCRVRCEGPVTVKSKGKTVKIRTVEESIIEFDTRRGSIYSLTRDTALD